MNDDFALLPWEYRGSGADLRAHATIPALEVGGKTRRLLLKQRHDVVYFKDAGSDLVFAVLRQFARMNVLAMCEAVREAVASNNYGRYSTNRLDFSPRGYNHNHTVVCLIHHEESGNGWLKEWFEPEWFLFEGSSPQDAIKNYTPALLNRAMNPKWRRNIVPHWINGSIPDLQHAMSLVCRLLLREVPDVPFPHYARLALMTRSPLGQSELVSDPTNFFHLAPTLQPLLCAHFVVRGLKWQRPPGYHLVSEHRTWGDNWRGHWSAVPNIIDIDINSVKHSTAHDRLELALELRDWLQDKLPEPEIDNLLRDTLEEK
jgi:hypothetical protein